MSHCALLINFDRNETNVNPFYREATGRSLLADGGDPTLEQASLFLPLLFFSSLY
jgi:hypothetical protein